MRLRVRRPTQAAWSSSAFRADERLLEIFLPTNHFIKDNLREAQSFCMPVHLNINAQLNPTKNLRPHTHVATNQSDNINVITE